MRCAKCDKKVSVCKKTEAGIYTYLWYECDICKNCFLVKELVSSCLETSC